MILSDRDIKKAIKNKRIVITPKPDYKVQLDACMIDLHLGRHFRVFKHSSYPYIDLKGKIDIDQLMKEIEVKKGQPFIMQPGDFALVTTVENLKLSDDLVG